MQRIETYKLSEIQRWPRNPKKHDIASIKASLQRFGYVELIVRDGTSGRIVAGHGRAEALEQLKAEGKKPPGNVEVGAGGEWLVPVLAGVAFADETAAEAYLVASNRIVETGGYDKELLNAILADLRDADALSGTGFSESEVDALLRSAAKDSTLPQSVLDEADATMDALDVGEAETRELVLHIEADEYQGFVSRLQAVMKAARGASWTDAVKALLDRWESDDDA